MGIIETIKIGMNTKAEFGKIKNKGMEAYVEQVISSTDIYGELAEDRKEMLRKAAREYMEIELRCPDENKRRNLKETMQQTMNPSKDIERLFSLNTTVVGIGASLKYLKATGKTWKHMNPDIQFTRLEEKLKE